MTFNNVIEAIKYLRSGLATQEVTPMQDSYGDFLRVRTIGPDLKEAKDVVEAIMALGVKHYKEPTVLLGGTMTKDEERAELDRAIERFGRNSYLGPWLQDHKEEILYAISNDLSVELVVDLGVADAIKFYGKHGKK